jgi:hypothetical protein
MSASGRGGVDVVVLAWVVTVVPIGMLGGTDVPGMELLDDGTELLDDGGTELLDGGTELLDGGTELLDGGTELLGVELELLELDELELLDELDDDGAELLELDATDDDGAVVSVPRSEAPATGPAIRPSPARARPNPATTAPTFVTRSIVTSRLRESCRTPQICQFRNGSHSPCRNDPKSPRRA